MKKAIQALNKTGLTIAILLIPVFMLADAAGIYENSVYAPHHEKVMNYAVWYPVSEQEITQPFGGNAVFLPYQVAQNAPIKQGRYPLILVSHGLGGHYGAQGWLASALARSGAIVVAVNHPNSTVLDFDMRAGLEHWTRTQDLKLVLDAILKDPDFSSLIDSTRISVVGFSYGGWTALSMAGVRGNLAGYVNHCSEQATQHCNDIQRVGIDLNSLHEKHWDGYYGDARISQVVAIDPGLTFGIESGDVATLSADVLLIQLGRGKDRLDATNIGVDGSGFSALLPYSEMIEIAPAYHFSMLPLCTPAGSLILEEEGEDAVCDDPEYSNREDIHFQVQSAVIDFLTLNEGQMKN